MTFGRRHAAREIDPDVVHRPALIRGQPVTVVEVADDDTRCRVPDQQGMVRSLKQIFRRTVRATLQQQRSTTDIPPDVMTLANATAVERERSRVEPIAPTPAAPTVTDSKVSAAIDLIVQ